MPARSHRSFPVGFCQVPLAAYGGEGPRRCQLDRPEDPGLKITLPPPDKNIKGRQCGPVGAPALAQLRTRGAPLCQLGRRVVL